MSRRGGGRNEFFWLWTGETEYEGQLIAVAATSVLARVRRSDHWTPENGAPGNAVPLDVMERQRRLSRSIGFGQSPAILAGSLLEFRVVTLQPSQDSRFDYVLSGMFWPVADEHLERLSQLNSNDAFHYLQSNSSRAYSPSRLQTGGARAC